MTLIILLGVTYLTAIFACVLIGRHIAEEYNVHLFIFKGWYFFVPLINVITVLVLIRMLYIIVNQRKQKVLLLDSFRFRSTKTSKDRARELLLLPKFKQTIEDEA